MLIIRAICAIDKSLLQTICECRGQHSALPESNDFLDFLSSNCSVLIVKFYIFYFCFGKKKLYLFLLHTVRNVELHFMP